MEEILDSLFTIALFPFTSNSVFVVIPFMLSFVSGSMVLIWRMIRGKY